MAKKKPGSSRLVSAMSDGPAKNKAIAAERAAKARRRGKKRNKAVKKFFKNIF